MMRRYLLHPLHNPGELPLQPLTPLPHQVTGEVQGPSSEISKFVEDLNQGPSAAKVSGVEQKELEVKSDGKEEGGFNVVK
jgi:hypothetical protein